MSSLLNEKRRWLIRTLKSNMLVISLNTIYSHSEKVDSIFFYKCYVVAEEWNHMNL